MTCKIYSELLRPRFHFTSMEGWLNDPNGLVFCDGEYHMFRQYRAPGSKTGWGHAISTDLLHWEDRGMVIPAGGEHGPAWSGSAVIDHKNLLGLQKGSTKTMLAYFTGKDTWGQYLYVSTDKGRQWSPYQKGPIVPMITKGNRDPKVFFHTESGRWVMVLWSRSPANTEDREDPNGVYIFLNSDDLIHWEQQSSIGPYFECPDLFRLPLEGGDGYLWALVDGTGSYKLGDFDGRSFIPQTDLIPGDLGNNFYATQTWNECPQGRVIQLTWMRNENDPRYPGMPFDQQMNFPCELRLSQTPEGPRIMRYPIAEIEKLHCEEVDTIADLNFSPLGIDGSCRVESGGVELLRIEKGKLSSLGRDVELNEGGEIRVLVDRCSVEIFLDGGMRCLSSCYLPQNNESLQVKSTIPFKCQGIESIWTTAEQRNG